MNIGFHLGIAKLSPELALSSQDLRDLILESLTKSFAKLPGKTGIELRLETAPDVVCLLGIHNYKRGQCPDCQALEPVKSVVLGLSIEALPESVELGELLPGARGVLESFLVSKYADSVTVVTQAADVIGKPLVPPDLLTALERVCDSDPQSALERDEKECCDAVNALRVAWDRVKDAAWAKHVDGQRRAL